MKKDFFDIRVCIWDFDGTLYRAGEAFHNDILETQYHLIMNHRGWEKKKAVEEFHKLYKVTTPSSTEVVSKLANVSIAQAAIEGEQINHRLKYIFRDEKLIQLFSTLSHHSHFILANGIKENILPALVTLGVPYTTFIEIVTSEVVGVNKPQPEGFLYIMEKTGLPAQQHLMIGDRDDVDLKPAKALGMRTCRVWTDKKSDVADITLPNVYEIANMLG